MRYFRAQTADSYEAVRHSLDAVYGYPNAYTSTVTSIPPAAVQFSDSSGRVYLVASEAECDFPAVAQLLPNILASGLIEEVTRDVFLLECPPPTL